VDNVDLSTFLDNAPGDTDTSAAPVEEEDDDDKTFDGDPSDDEAEDGLEGGADSAISGGPVIAVPPVVAAVEITDSQAGEDLGPTDGDNPALVSNEASGMPGDFDVEMSELPVDGECYLLWPFSITVSLYFFSSYQKGPQTCCASPRPQRR
jgi:hypothetical protein